MTDKNQFGERVKEALKERGMIPADLARETGMDTGAISNTLSGRRGNPTPETCRLFAKALDLPPEVVFRWAGYLPEPVKLHPTTERIVHLVEELDDPEKTNILQYTELRHQIFTETVRRKRPKSKPA